MGPSPFTAKPGSGGLCARNKTRGISCSQTCLSQLRKGRGGLGLRVDSAPSMGPGIAGWPYALEAPCYPRKWGCGG